MLIRSVRSILGLGLTSLCISAVGFIPGVPDARATLIQAHEAALNSVYTFPIDLVNSQGAVEQFYLLLSDAERGALSDDLMAHIPERTHKYRPWRKHSPQQGMKQLEPLAASF